jgi:hypothetical protein
VEHRGPTRARATERRLEVECASVAPTTWSSNLTPDEATSARWRFPGLEVAVDTAATLAATSGSTLRYRPAPSAPTRFALTLTPTSDAAEV